LEQLKETLVRTVTADDLIKALLCEVGAETISKDPERIHEAFYMLRQDYPKLLSDFHFDTSGLSAFSDLLDRVLFRLETSSVLGTVNPRFSVYELRASMKDELKRTVLPKFSPDTRKVLQEVSHKLEELVKD
jgi:hypothetical protein